MEWTAEDAKRARNDGWKLIGGNVFSVYGPKGSARFGTTLSIYEHIARKAQTDPWYREVYLNTPVGGFEGHIAGKEGWAWDPRTFQIYPENKVPFVLARAEAGSFIHQKILTFLARRRLGAKP
jgi:hypothetical protein